MEQPAADIAVRTEIQALHSAGRLIPRQTKRAVTPLGGVAVFRACLRKTGLAGKVREHLPVRWRSPDNIGPAAAFTAFLMAVPAGAMRFAYANVLHGSSTQRRCVAIRERVRECRASAGRKLIEAPGYTFRIFATSRPDGARESWRDHNRRADMENLSAQLKHGLNAGHLCLKRLHATGAALRTVPLLCNMLAWFQRAAGMTGCREPAAKPEPAIRRAPGNGWHAFRNPNSGSA